MIGNSQEYKLLRDIPLTDVSTVAEVQVKRHEHTFGLVTPQRTYYVEAPTRQIMQDWVNRIELTKAEAKRSLEEEDSNLTTTHSPETVPATHIDPPTPNASTTLPINISPSSPPSTNDPRFGSYTSSTTTDNSLLSSSVTSSQGTSDDSQGLGGSQLHQFESSTPTEHRTAKSSAASARSRDNSVGGYISSGNEGPSYFTTSHHPPPRLVRHHSEQIGSSSEEEDEDDFDREPVTPGPGSPMSPKTLHVGALPDPKKIILQGYLTKQGKRKTWRKRYFTLVSSRLMYTRSHMVGLFLIVRYNGRYKNLLRRTLKSKDRYQWVGYWT